MDQQSHLVGKEERYQSLWRISLIAWNITWSSFYFGYTLVYLGTLPFQTIIKVYSIQINRGTAEGILNGCIPIGGLFGAMLFSFTIQNFSRKNNLLLTNLAAFILGFLIFIPNFYTFLAFRFCQGICVGIFSGLAPLIVREIVPVELSGSLGTFVQMNITLGLLAAYLSTYLLKQATGDLTCQSFWPVIFSIAQVIIMIQSFVVLYVFPFQTPKYLLQQGREEEAIEILELIYKSEYVGEVLQEKRKDVQQLKTLQKIHEQSVLSEQSPQNKIKKSKLANIMGVHVIVMAQMSGINAFNVYCGPIVSQATSPQIATFLPTLIIIEKLLTTFGTTFLAVRFGRKTILQVGIFLQGVGSSLVTLGFLLHNEDSAANERAFEILVIIGVFFFMAIFGLTIGPISWVYLAESMEPNKVPIAIFCHWIACSFVVTLFPIIKENVLGGDPTLLFAFFTLWSMASLIVNRFFLLETKDKTQQQIREEYANCKIC